MPMLFLCGPSQPFSAARTPDLPRKTGLIHEYHRERVRSEDMAAYGRAFSTGLFALAGTLVLSGIVPLLWTLPGAVTASLVVLFVGLAASFAILWRVQRRYNGGML